MYCKKCGAKIDDDSLFCPMCGTPVSQPNQPRAGLDSDDPFDIPEPNASGGQTQQGQPDQQNQYRQNPDPNGGYYPPPPYYPYPPQPAQPGPLDKKSGGFAALCFFFPIVGLILFIVWHDSLPLRARSCGKGALAGVITYVCLVVILYVIIFIALV